MLGESGFACLRACCSQEFQRETVAVVEPNMLSRQAALDMWEGQKGRRLSTSVATER